MEWDTSSSDGEGWEIREGGRTEPFCAERSGSGNALQGNESPPDQVSSRSDANVQFFAR